MLTGLCGRAARWLLLALLGFVAALGGLYVAYTRSEGGPGNDVDLAARSLKQAIARTHPRWRNVDVTCDGQRDGSNFFGCTVARLTARQVGYSVTLDEGKHVYRADGDGNRGARETLLFRPAE